MISYVDCHWVLRRVAAHVHRRVRRWHRPIGHHHHAGIVHRAAKPQAWQWVCRAVVIGGSIGGLTGAAPPQSAGAGGETLPSAYPPASYGPAPEGFPGGGFGGGGFGPSGLFGPGFAGPQASQPFIVVSQTPPELPAPTPEIVASLPPAALPPEQVFPIPPLMPGTTMPEPASFVLLGFGLAVIAALRLRTQR